ncbi:MAG: cation:proton antiporter, partial [Nitrosarchaeum sp.]|nr:cation:proton antiporter [Nitrosarchaeum sp.]
MDNYALQIDSSGIQTILNQIMTSFIDQITHIPHTSFVTDLAFIMIIGAIVTLAFFKIKQPLIIGYLFAGMLLGPLSPLWSWILPTGSSPSDMLKGVGILTDMSALNLFSEIGVILLLFVIGIEFPYAKIKSIGRMAIGIGTIGLVTTLGAIFYAAISLGLNSMDSLFIAAALSISSTAVIVKILEEMGRIKRESTILVLGILIVEDVIAVILISS